MITNRFSPTRPISCAQGRHGEVIAVQGNGVRPVRIDGGGAGRDAGVDAPSAAPSVSASPSNAFYIARADISKPGAVYYSPPPVTLSTSLPSPDLGKFRKASISTFLSQGAVFEARVDDGGKYYAEPPTVTLGNTHGKGAVLRAVLDGTDAISDPSNNPYTGITDWRIVQAPDAVLEGDVDDGKTWYAAANRSYVMPARSGSVPTVTAIAIPSGRLWTGVANCPCYRDECETNALFYTVAGGGGGSGATFRILFSGADWVCTTSVVGNTKAVFRGARKVESITPVRYGAGYSDTDPVVVRIPAMSGDSSRDIIIEGYTANNPNNTAARRSSVREIKIDNPGSGYVIAPEIKITSNSGFGAYATCTVKDGKIATVTIENCGGGYRSPPLVTAVAGSAEVFAVSRPHLRGTYQCYYRYIDDTPVARGGPVPSNLSPVREVDAGEGAAFVTWSAPVPPAGRAKRVELWRTTSGQATMLYRVVTYDGGAFADDLTDDELRDADRPEYAAMPIVLPNGELNANRFGVPPSDMAAAVRFQDRVWYGVSTDGKRPNTVMFSETDEPESVPDINEVVIQQNARDTDAISALIPFGPTLLIMQSRHAYALTFSKQPVLDAQVSPIAFRGALNQRCWSIYEGVCYVLDAYGVYAITPDGQISSLSDPISDVFRSRVDYGKSTWNFVTVDPVTRMLRVFVAMRDDAPNSFPTRAICYSISSQSWWMECYPQRISAGAHARLSNGDYKSVYGAAGGMYLLGDGAADTGRGSIIRVTITQRGAGYTSPPEVAAEGGVGALFQSAIDSEGRLKAIWIINPGTGYTSGNLYVAPPSPAGGSSSRAHATFVATSTTSDTPIFPTYRFRSACVDYATDAVDPKAGSAMSRSVRLLYRPQPHECVVSMRPYYNNAEHPRQNVVYRNRGIGFAADELDGGSRLDMAENTVKHGADTGVASALLAGRTLDDTAGGDRHVSVELIGARKNAEPVTFYKLDIMGGGK